MADEIDDVPETGGPSAAPASDPSAPASTPSSPPATAGGRLDPNKIVKPPVKKTRYISADWQTVKDQPGPGLQEVSTETDTYADGHTAEYVLDASGSRYPQPAKTGQDIGQRQIWEAQVKDTAATAAKAPPGGKTEIVEAGRRKSWNPDSQPPAYNIDLGPADEAGSTASTIVEIDGKRFGIAQKKNPDGTVGYIYTDMQSGQTVPGLPAAKDKPPTTQFTKAGDGKTYIITVGPDGQIIGEPKDSGLPADIKPGSTQYIKGGDGKTYAVTIGADGQPGKAIDTGIPAETKNQTFAVDTPTGKKLVQVDDAGNSKEIYSAAAGETLEHDPKNGRWFAKGTDKDGKATLREVTPEGQTPSAPTTMGDAPKAEDVVKWLWAEQAKLDQMVADKKITREEAIDEMANRHKFAETIVAQQTAQQAREDKTADRNQRASEDAAATYRQGLSTGGNIYTSVAPKALEMGAKLLPGNGQVAAQGFMAMLAAGRQFAEQMAGPKPGAVTTVKPDGTVTVQHAPAAAAPAAPSTPQEVAAAITGGAPQSIQNADGTQSSPLGGVYVPGSGPATGEMGPTLPSEGGWMTQTGTTPAFSPTPTSMPGSTPLPGTDPNAVAAMLAQPGGGMPGWAAAQANEPPQNPQDPDSSYLYDVLPRDAVDEARRRDRMAVQGVAA